MTRLTRNQKILIPLGLLIITASVTMAFGLAGYFNGTVTSSGTITSTTTTQAAPILALGAASATQGGTCTVNSATSITCTGTQIGQGGSYVFSFVVTNSGNADATVTATSTANTPADSTVALTLGTATQTVAANGGEGSWTFTYTAGQTTGASSVTITVSA